LKCYYREFSQISPAAIKSFGSVYTRTDFNFHCISLCHKHGYQFIVLGHQQIWLVWYHVKTLFQNAYMKKLSKYTNKRLLTVYRVFWSLKQSTVLEVVFDNDICDSIKHKLDVVCVCSTCEVGVNLFCVFSLVEVFKLKLNVSSGFLICVWT